MSSLSVYHESCPELPNKVLTHFEDIASTLAEKGVRFDRWQAATKSQPGASQEEVIAAYRVQIDQLMSERGYITVDVVSLNSDHPQKAELRAKFLDEHQHGEDEVRFFVAPVVFLPCMPFEHSKRRRGIVRLLAPPKNCRSRKVRSADTFVRSKSISPVGCFIAAGATCN